MKNWTSLERDRWVSWGFGERRASSTFTGFLKEARGLAWLLILFGRGCPDSPAAPVYTLEVSPERPSPFWIIDCPTRFKPLRVLPKNRVLCFSKYKAKRQTPTKIFPQTYLISVFLFSLLRFTRPETKTPTKLSPLRKWVFFFPLSLFEDVGLCELMDGCFTKSWPCPANEELLKSFSKKA